MCSCTSGDGIVQISAIQEDPSPRSPRRSGSGLIIPSTSPYTTDFYAAGCNLAAHDLRQALNALACADLALLLLPLALLTTLSDADDACGWSTDALDTLCALALAFLWMSLFLAASQLVALSAVGPNRRHIFVRRLWWHVPAVALGTCVGGAIGIYALSGYLVLQRGECKQGFRHMLAGGVGVSYFLGAIYAFHTLVEAKAGSKPAIVSPEPLSCADADLLSGIIPSNHLPASVPKVGGAGRPPEAVTNKISIASKTTHITVASASDLDPESPQRSRLGPSSPSPADTFFSSAGSQPSRNWAVEANPESSDMLVPHHSEVRSIGDDGSSEDRKSSHESMSAGSRDVKHPLRLSRPMANGNLGSLARLDGISELKISIPDGADDKRKMIVKQHSPTELSAREPTVCSWGTAVASSKRRRSNENSFERRRKSDQDAPPRRRLSYEEQCRRSSDPPSLHGNKARLPCPLNSVAPTTPCGENACEDPNEELFDDLFQARRSSFREGEDPCGRLRRISAESQRGKAPSNEDATPLSPSGMSGLSSSSPSSPMSSPNSPKSAFRMNSKDASRCSTLRFAPSVDVTEVAVESEMKTYVPRASSPIIDETVFRSSCNPINFGNLRPCSGDESASELTSSGESGSDDGDIRADGIEVWHSTKEGKVEVPMWLLEKWQSFSRGESDSDNSPKVPSGEKKKKLTTRSRRASLAVKDLEDAREEKRVKEKTDREDKKKAPLKPSSFGKPIVSPANTFWKIPMPTRKNSTMIPVPVQGQQSSASTAASAAASASTGSIDSASSGGDLEDDDESSEEEEEREQELEEDQDQLLPGASASPNGSMTRRISFMDEELGTPLEKYSDEKKERKEAKLRASLQRLGAITEATTKETDENDDEEPSLETLLSIPPKYRQRQGSRRPSMLGVFSDDSAKGEGVYVVNDKQHDTTQVLKVQRNSLMMSSSVLLGVLKDKVDCERIEEMNQSGPIDVQSQVVLPFFSASQVNPIPYFCSCATDPETGKVVHTCMTPTSTMGTNTGAYTSYLCSEWGSPSGSRRGSHGSHSSEVRRGSRGSDGGRLSDDAEVIDLEDRDEVPDLLKGVPPPPKQKYQRKRVRNASMLAEVGARGPQAATKVEVEDDPAQDNELAISYKSLQNIEKNLRDQSPRASWSPHGEATIDPTMPETRGEPDVERSVEREIGHRFDLVEPFILADMLADPGSCEQVLTVDVRGRDWVGGHIPSSINLRTSEVVSNPQTLLVKCRQNRVHHIVFTCMYSVLRARKCAQAVEKAQAEETKAGFAAYKIRISLLAGGMHAWVNHFIKNPLFDEPPKAYIDNFDPEMWSDGGPSQGGLVHVMDALWSSGGQKALSDALTQELEQLLVVRTASQQSSRRESVSSESKAQNAGESKYQAAGNSRGSSTIPVPPAPSNPPASPAPRELSPEGPDSETAALARQVAQDFALMRQSAPLKMAPRRGSGESGGRGVLVEVASQAS